MVIFTSQKQLKMPKIKIWSAKEIELYDHPPVFNSIGRKKFFTLPMALEKRVRSFYTNTNKVGFYLMYGYFKARRRFFLPQRFQSSDIEFVSKRLGLLFTDGILESYNRKTYNRHRKIILAHFGYEAFSVSKHHPLITQLMEKALWSFDRAHLILGNVLGWLEYRHIELPSYYALQTILTTTVRKRDRILHGRLNTLLQPIHKAALDPLLLKINAQDSGSTYVFMNLKKLICKDNPKSIRINIEKHGLIWQIHKQIQLLLPQLDLSEAAIRYFEELVIKYKSSQIMQRSMEDKYLLLLGFTAFRIRSYEDQLVDILLSACRSGINTAHNEAIRSTTHSTDTHGYTEAVFGLMDILGFGFAPGIAKLHRQQLYSFEKIATYKEKAYPVLPDGYINVELIEDNRDAILRLVTSIKLKHCSASQIFKRLNSYSRQHPVYQALKEYGKIIKTIYILRYMDLLELR